MIKRKTEGQELHRAHLYSNQTTLRTLILWTVWQCQVGLQI